MRHHLAVPVSDLARSQAWYERVLGAVLERSTDTAEERAAGRVPQSWLTVAGATLNLAEHGVLPRDPERHFLHVAITDDAGRGLNGWLSHLDAHATDPIGPYAHGGLSFISLYFDDPDGFRWEVVIDYPNPDAALAAVRAADGAIGSPVREYPWPS